MSRSNNLIFSSASLLTARCILIYEATDTFMFTLTFWVFHAVSRLLLSFCVYSCLETTVISLLPSSLFSKFCIEAVHASTFVCNTWLSLLHRTRCGTTFLPAVLYHCLMLVRILISWYSNCNQYRKRVLNTFMKFTLWQFSWTINSITYKNILPVTKSSSVWHDILQTSIGLRKILASAVSLP